MERDQIRVDFFVSYTNVDRAWAEWIAAELEDVGYTTVLQAWDFRPGENFILRMHEALEQADRVLAVLSPAYLESAYATDEWTAALVRDNGGQDRLLPVRVQECELRGLLASRIYIDLVGMDEPTARQRLLAGVREQGVRPTTAPFPHARQSRAAGTPRFPGDLPPIWNVPYRQHPSFTGRDDALSQLRAGISQPLGVRLPQVIVGMAGVGKTQLMVEYAHRMRADFDVVWWIRANERATLLGDYAALARELGIAEQPDQEATAAVVHDHLRSQQRWLLMFDNVEDPQVVHDLLRRSGPGQVLLTSRRELDWERIAIPVPLEVLSPDDATGLLLALTRESDEPAARALAAELGGLPLALEQAGAFIAQSSVISLAGYRELFDSRSKELLGLGRPLIDAHTVDTTWDLALQRLQQEAPAAVELITLAAFYAAEDLPLPLLATSPVELPKWLAAAARDLLALSDVLTALRRHSLIKMAGDGLWVHRLLQTVIRDDLDDPAQRGWAGVAVRLLVANFPEESGDVRTWAVCERLVPHALAAVGHTERLRVDPQATAWLMDRAATYLQGRGQLTKAKVLFEQALAISKAAVGPDHPDVGTFSNNLGRVLRALGDLPGARVQFERALRIHEAALGPHHPDVSRDHNNLGIILRALGDLPGARVQFEWALRISEVALGQDHPRTAMFRNNLGSVLRDLGDVAGARVQFEQALATYEATVGPDHPDVAIVCRNLGHILQELGDRSGAQLQFERALAISEAALRSDHPTGPIVLGSSDMPQEEKGSTEGPTSAK